MGRIPEDTVRTILDRTDIVQVIGDFVRLEKKGNRYWGLCPFHNEKSPSFSVDSDKGFFYCFGCHKGGDVITFLKEAEKLDYREALEELAKRAGVPIEEESAPSEEEKNRKALLELYDRLAGTFHYLLTQHKSGADAAAYLRRRGVPDSFRESFRLGYAPADRKWLFSFLKSKGYSSEFLAHSGVFSAQHPDFPLFADRLIFPICSPKGETIAFGGRLLQGDGPKYMNSPDTALFHKQENLFALDKALPWIKKENKVLVCEGYMDALSYQVAGISWAVAPLGTAFTERQAHMLRRWTENVILAFDSDDAGKRAADKGCVTAASAGLSVKVLIVQDGKDASEILEKEGPGSLQKVQNLIINGDDFLLKRAKELFDIESVDGRARAAAFLDPYAAALDSEVKRDAFFELASRSLRTDPQSLRTDYERAQQGQRREYGTGKARMARKAGESGENDAPGAVKKAVRTPDLTFLLALAANEDSFGRVRSCFAAADLEDERAKEIYIALEECFRADEHGIEAIASRIGDESLRAAVMESAFSGEFSENAERFIDDGVLRIRRRSLEERRRRLREQIAELGSQADGLSELQYELMHIDAELMSTKDERDERT